MEQIAMFRDTIFYDLMPIFPASITAFATTDKDALNRLKQLSEQSNTKP